MKYVGKLKEVGKILLREVTRAQKDKYLMFSFLCGS